MLNLQPSDRVEFSFEDGPTTTICATVDRLLTDQDGGMDVEIEDYIARWIEITVDEPSGTPNRFCCLERIFSIS